MFKIGKNIKMILYHLKDKFGVTALKKAKALDRKAVIEVLKKTGVQDTHN